MPDRKQRIPIPGDLAADVMFRANRTCCVCHIEGRQVQIHHINDDPSCNDAGNLAVLCLECHSQTQMTGGFGRKLNANLVTLYRDHWDKVISLRLASLTLNKEISRNFESEAPAVLADDGPVRNFLQSLTSQFIDSAPSSSSAFLGDGTPSGGELGQSFRNDGIVITIIEVQHYVEITLDESGSTASGEEGRVQVAAGEGAKFITVMTRVFNDARVSLDLTCGFPIKNHLVDDRGREFDPISKLYKVRGNPPCNAKLQPGFEVDMTYIYRIPITVNVRYFQFEDVTEFWNRKSTGPTRIPLTVLDLE